MDGFQALQDFETDNVSLVTGRGQAVARPLAVSSKKKRQAIDADSLRMENLALDEIQLTNWVGKLSEYRDAHPVTDGLKYAEKTIDGLVHNRYTCAALIFESTTPFGASVSFSSKKSAKQYAAKIALDWLIANKHMPSDGRVKFPRVVQPPLTKGASVTRTGLKSSQPSTDDGSTYASQVPLLCARLGINVPRYELYSIVLGAPLYDCWAEFSDPAVEERVGKVSSIHGKKNAKELTAKEVVRFLEDIERQRMAGVEGDDERSKRTGSADAPQTSLEFPGNSSNV